MRARRGGYDKRILAAFLGVERDTGDAVAITIHDGLPSLDGPPEPDGYEPTSVDDYHVTRAYVASPEHVEASVTPRLHVPTALTDEPPRDLVDADFALERDDPPKRLLVAFAEWPAYGEAISDGVEVYDLEYFMLRHGP